MRIGIDIGGTFTDFMLVGDDGALEVFKTPSTPRAPEQAVFAGLEALAERHGGSVAAFLATVDLVVHGTTIATNTVIQRSGPTTGVLHTEGFRDILFLRDGWKPDRYNLHLPPPEPLVPRYLRLGVRERVLATGDVAVQLDERSVREAAAVLAREGVESVAVCLLWSFLNPRHERRVAELLREELPGAHVALSSDVLPAMREYPRASATTLSAYVGPSLGRYLTRVADHLREHGYAKDLLIMQVTGGSARARDIERRPVLAIGSGPAAGPAAGVAIGSDEPDGNLMVVEMGGTSFDVSLIRGGAIPVSQHVKVGDMPIGVAAVDVHSVGAGGGSIAWIDPGGMLRVGPRSAGADPGPACYGLGGGEPTVTDANLVLGYLNPDFFLGGRMKLDRARAAAALEGLAEALGLDVVSAAAAVYRVVNTTMVGAMRAVSVMRGIDPREHTVVVGGGAGGTHGAKIAEELGVRKVICPTVAGALCAFGMLVADVRHSYVRTAPTSTARLDEEAVRAIFVDLEAQAERDLGSQGFAREAIRLERSADARYPYQFHELIVGLPGGELTAASVAGAFHDTHERLYNYCMRDMPVDVVAWRLTAVGVLPELTRRVEPGRPADADEALKGTREVFFEDAGGFVPTPIYDGTRLPIGAPVPGPAVAELGTSTVVVFPDHVLSVNARGDFELEVPGEREAREPLGVGSAPAP